MLPTFYSVVRGTLWLDWEAKQREKYREKEIERCMKKGNIKLTNKSKTAGIEDCYFTCTSNNNK